MTTDDDLRAGLQSIAAEVTTVDLRDGVLARSRRIRVRRTTTAAAAGVLAVTLAVAGVLRQPVDDRPPITGVTPTATPSLAPTVLPSRSEQSPDMGPFKNVTVEVPPWGPAGEGCPSGRMPFSEAGQHYSGNGVAIDVLSYLMADVDHDGDQDYVAHLKCHADVAQIVAFQRSSGEMRLLGRVVGRQDGMGMMDSMEFRDGRIAVLVSAEYTDIGQNHVPNQWRVYAWQNGSFKQVEGPTSFPPNPPSSVLSVQPSDLVFRRTAGEQYAGEMTVTVRNTGTVDIASGQVDLFLPPQVRPAGDGWGRCTAGAGTALTVLTCGFTGLRGGTSQELRLGFVADGRPKLTDEAWGPTNHSVSVKQIPPYDGLLVATDAMEATVRIVVP